MNINLSGSPNMITYADELLAVCDTLKKSGLNWRKLYEKNGYPP